MKISVISISVNITGTLYANIVYMHYLRNSAFQLEVSGSNDVIVSLSKFISVLNSSPSVQNGHYTSVIFSVSGIVHSLTASHSSSMRWEISTPCHQEGL